MGHFVLKLKFVLYPIVLYICYPFYENLKKVKVSSSHVVFYTLVGQQWSVHVYLIL